MSAAKGKKTTADAGPGNTFAERAIADDERIELQKRVADAEAQLREEAKLIDRLTRENQSKSEQIQSMEMAMQKEMEKQLVDREILQQEVDSLRQQSSHDLEVARHRIQELERGLEAYDVLERTNVTLRSRVDTLMEELSVESKKHAEEINKMRKDMFNHKMTLEQTFRKTLQEMDGDYLKKAFDAMTEESKNALTANAKLKEELFMQSNGVENLMQRFSAQGDKFHTLKVENDILEKGSHLRQKEISQLKRKQYEYESRIAELQKIVREQPTSTEDAKKIDTLQQDVQQYKHLYEHSQKRTAKWKNRAMELAAEKRDGRFSRYSSMQASSLAGTTLDKHDFGGDMREMWSASLALTEQSSQTPALIKGDRTPPSTDLVHPMDTNTQSRSKCVSAPSSEFTKKTTPADVNKSSSFLNRLRTNSSSSKYRVKRL